MSDENVQLNQSGNGKYNDVGKRETADSEEGNLMNKMKFTLTFMAIMFAGISIVIFPILSAKFAGANFVEIDSTAFLTTLIAVLLGLTTMTVTGIFVFMTFRIDRGVQMETKKVAKQTAFEEVNRCFDEWAEKQFDQLKKRLKFAENEAIILRKEAMEKGIKSFNKIDQLENEVNEYSNSALEKIRSQVENVEAQAQTFLRENPDLVMKAVSEIAPEVIEEQVVANLHNNKSFQEFVVENIRDNTGWRGLKRRFGGD